MKMLYCLSVWLAFSLPISAHVISLSTPVSTTLMPDGIYWNFDGGKPGDSEPNPAHDVSGNGLNGFLLQGANGEWPVYEEGKFGTAIRITGSDPHELDPRVTWKPEETSNHPGTGLDLAGASFTAGAWVKINLIKSGEPQAFCIMDQRVKTPEGNRGWGVWLIKTDADTWQLRLTINDTYINSQSPVDFGEGEWHHVAFSYDAEGTTGKLLFWLDGLPLGGEIEITEKLPSAGEADDQSRIFSAGERTSHYYTSDSDASLDDLFVTRGVHDFCP